MRGKCLKLKRLKRLRLSKAIIANNWFSGSVQVCIIVVEHDNWIKRNVNVLNRRLITCIVRLQKILWSANF